MDSFERFPQNPYIWNPHTGRAANMIDPNGNFNVTLGDQTTRAIDLYFGKFIGATTIASEVSVGDKIINVVNAAAYSAGHLLTFIDNADGNPTNPSQARVVSKLSNAITIDRPIDNSFAIGDHVAGATTNLAVNGSTPQIFSIRNAKADPDIPAYFDITRILMVMITATATEYADFGDITALTNGIVFRKRSNGNYDNYWNVKKNGDFAVLAYDLNILDASNPGLGVYGLSCRLSFAGPEKHGVALRIAPMEDIELIVQDNLAAITSFEMMAQGHLVI